MSPVFPALEAPVPAYPCVQCGNPVDTSGDGRCKKCQEQRPFKCSKCDRQMGLLSLHAPEKLTFRKPLYCQDCGPAAESVDCRQCGVSLTRSNGVEVTLNGVRVVYHPECYARQKKIHGTVKPIALVAGFLICGYFGYGLTDGWMTAAAGGGVGILAGLAVSKLFASG